MLKPEADHIEKIIEAILIRFKELKSQKDIYDFLNHLISMSRWHKEPMDYKMPKKIDFPGTIHIAYAVCHPSCGTQEFIVDGQTQECQCCGGLMFRGPVREYKKIINKKKLNNLKRKIKN